MRRLVLLPLLLAAHAAHAQDDAERFQIERDGDGYVRMDTQTGAMSLCREEGERLICRLAADDRDAMLTETERLRDELKALEDRVSTLEKAPAVKLPSEEDIDRTLGIMERFVRRFKDAAEGKPAEPAPPVPPKPAPDHT